MFHDVTNNFNVMGRMTRELEVRNFPNGGSIGVFAICHNGGYKGKDGKWVEKPIFIDVKAHGPVMDFIGENCPKGTMVFISGPIEQENWESEGQKRSRLVVNLVSIKKMPTGEKKEVGGNDEVPKANAAPAGKKTASAKKANAAPVEETTPPVVEDDVPF